jgi:hypothetical protein
MCRSGSLFRAIRSPFVIPSALRTFSTLLRKLTPFERISLSCIFHFKPRYPPLGAPNRKINPRIAVFSIIFNCAPRLRAEIKIINITRNLALKLLTIGCLLYHSFLSLSSFRSALDFSVSSHTAVSARGISSYTCFITEARLRRNTRKLKAALTRVADLSLNNTQFEHDCEL